MEYITKAKIVQLEKIITSGVRKQHGNFVVYKGKHLTNLYKKVATSVPSPPYNNPLPLYSYNSTSPSNIIENRTYNLHFADSIGSLILAPELKQTSYSWGYGPNKDQGHWINNISGGMSSDKLNWSGWNSQTKEVVITQNQQNLTLNYYHIGSPVVVPIERIRLADSNRIVKVSNPQPTGFPGLIGYMNYIFKMLERPLTLLVNEPISISFLKLDKAITTWKDPVLPWATIRIKCLSENSLPYDFVLSGYNIGENVERHFVMYIYTDRVEVHNEYMPIASKFSLPNLDVNDLNKRRVAVFPNKFDISDSKSESLQIQIVPMGGTILIFWIVNQNIVGEYAIAWPQEIDYSTYWDNSNPDDVSKIMKYNPYSLNETMWDFERKEFNYRVNTNPLENKYCKTYMDKIPDLQRGYSLNRVVWEELANVELLFSGLLNLGVKVCPALFQSQGAIRTDPYFLGYAPTEYGPDDINYNGFSNPSIWAKIFKTTENTTYGVSYGSDSIYKIDDRKEWDRDNTFYSIFQYFLVGANLIPSSLNPHFNEFLDMMIAGDPNNISTNSANNSYSHFTPVLQAIFHTYEKEAYGEAYKPPDKYLNVDIISINKTESTDSSGIKIPEGRINIQVVCYGASHTFLKSGMKIRCIITVGDMEQNLGIYNINKIEKNREIGDIVYLNLECESELSSRLRRAVIRNCKLYDGWNHVEVVRDLLSMADMDYMVDGDIQNLYFRAINPPPTTNVHDITQTLPWSSDENTSAWRPTRFSSVFSHIEEILNYTGWQISSNISNDLSQDGKVIYTRRLKANEIYPKCLFADDIDMLREIYNEDEDYTNPRNAVLPYGSIDDKSFHLQSIPFIQGWSFEDDYPDEIIDVPIIPYSKLSEIEDDELMTRIIVMGLNFDKVLGVNTTKKDVEKILGTVNSVNVFTNLISASNYTNYKLENEISESRIMFYTNKKLIHKNMCSLVAKQLFEVLCKRHKWYKLIVDDFTYIMDLKINDKVALYSNTQRFLDPDINNVILDEQSYDAHIEYWGWRFFRVVGYEINITQTTRTGSVLLGEFLPDIAENINALTMSNQSAGN